MSNLFAVKSVRNEISVSLSGYPYVKSNPVQSITTHMSTPGSLEAYAVQAANARREQLAEELPETRTMITTRRSEDGRPTVTNLFIFTPFGPYIVQTWTVSEINVLPLDGEDDGFEETM